MSSVVDFSDYPIHQLSKLLKSKPKHITSHIYKSFLNSKIFLSYETSGNDVIKSDS